jgi:hypothetical protein
MSLGKMYEDHPYLCWAAIIVVLLLFVSLFAAESFTNRTVNMIAYRNPDPTLYKYTNRQRDPSGMDLNDYYLENDATFEYGLGAELAGDAAFVSRVITEDTILKQNVPAEKSAEHFDSNLPEDFAGGMAY